MQFKLKWLDNLKM